MVEDLAAALIVPVDREAPDVSASIAEFFKKAQQANNEGAK